MAKYIYIFCSFFLEGGGGIDACKAMEVAQTHHTLLFKLKRKIPTTDRK